MQMSLTSDKERPFSVADALALIGAIAVGLVSIRGWDSPRWCTVMVGLHPDQVLSPNRRIFQAIEIAASWTIPFALSLTVALLILRLRRPRPPIRRIASQPGTVACFAALAAYAFHVVEDVYCWVLAYLTRPKSAVQLPSPPFIRYDNIGYHPPVAEWLRSTFLEQFPTGISPSVAVAIIIGWYVIFASGRWRRPSGWIERAGRWLGVLWIGLAVLLAMLMKVGEFVQR